MSWYLWSKLKVSVVIGRDNKVFIVIMLVVKW